MNARKLIALTLAGIILFGAGICVGLFADPAMSKTDESDVQIGYAANPAHEYIAGAAAWQMSAEAHALMMQGFHIAETNIDQLARMADSNEQGYHWVEEDGVRKMFLNQKRVCVVCDIDDTLVDGVHYTANILGKNGEWTNRAFTDFILSNGCTALPGAVEFTNHCVENGIAIFYVTNRYDQGYKISETGYAGQEGYKKADGSIIGSSTYDLFGKTMYDITMESMASLEFPINMEGAVNYCSDARLIVNDTKLNGSSKEHVRQAIASGETISTGERAQESNQFPATFDLVTHHISMLLGDDLNDISQIFSDSSDSVARIALAIDYMDKWGTEWIVFPNAVYGSSMNYAVQYGMKELYTAFDYTDKETDIWNMYAQSEE